MNASTLQPAEVETFSVIKRSGKYLSFILGSEEYGIAILAVREIMGMMKITSVPHVPLSVKGVINLRGSVIPVIDLRLKFAMPEKEYDKETCIVVVNLHDRLMGVIVDTVSEVLNIHEEEIDDSPNFGFPVGNDFILGMSKVKDKVVILLNIDKVLKPNQVTAIQSAVAMTEKEESHV